MDVGDCCCCCIILLEMAVGCHVLFDVFGFGVIVGCCRVLDCQCWFKDCSGLSNGWGIDRCYGIVWFDDSCWIEEVMEFSDTLGMLWNWFKGGWVGCVGIYRIRDCTSVDGVCWYCGGWLCRDGCGCVIIASAHRCWCCCFSCCFSSICYWWRYCSRTWQAFDCSSLSADVVANSSIRCCAVLKWKTYQVRLWLCFVLQ